MTKKSINSFKKNIKGLWNHEPYVKKYKKAKYTNKSLEQDHMVNRLKTVNKILKQNLNKNSNILELGFGAGQSASLFLKEGFKYTGMDISESLVNFAKSKNKKFVKKKIASFYVGSMDKKLKFKNKQFDAVIIIGALQYVMNLNGLMREIKRVLKKDGIFILAITNSFNITDIVSPRKFLKFLARVIYKEHFMYSYSTTFKSILTETTNLKKQFKITGNEKWLNKNFFTKGNYLPWSFKGKRRILSYDRIRNLISKYKFQIIYYDYGGVFFYRKTKNKIINLVFDLSNYLLNLLYKIFIFNFLLKRIGSSNIFLLKDKS